MNQKTLVIVPTYNERENLRSSCSALWGSPLQWTCSLSMVIRPMAPAKFADEIAAKNARVHVFHEKERPTGRAY